MKVLFLASALRYEAIYSFVNQIYREGASYRNAEAIRHINTAKHCIKLEPNTNGINKKV